MLKSDTKFTWTKINLYASLYHHYQQMHLTEIYSSSSFLKASPQVLLGLQYFDKICFILFSWRCWFVLAACRIWHRPCLLKHQLNNEQFHRWIQKAYHWEAEGLHLKRSWNTPTKTLNLCKNLHVFVGMRVLWNTGQDFSIDMAQQKRILREESFLTWLSRVHRNEGQIKRTCCAYKDERKDNCRQDRHGINRRGTSFCSTLLFRKTRSFLPFYVDNYRGLLWKDLEKPAYLSEWKSMTDKVTHPYKWYTQHDFTMKCSKNREDGNSYRGPGVYVSLKIQSWDP